MNSVSSRVLAVVMLGSFALGGCTRELPPLAEPGREVPRIEVAPPVEPGKGRVAIDPVNDRAQVVEVVDESFASASSTWGGSAWASGQTTRPLCTAPCVVNLGYGSHTVRLQSTTDSGKGDRVSFVVGEQPSIVRADLGQHRGVGNPWLAGLFASCFGGAGMIFGGAYAAAQDKDAGLAVLGVSSAVTIGGAALMMLFPAIEQKGSSIQFTAADGKLYR